MSTIPSNDPAPDRNPLPEGTLAVGAGLVVSGAAAYGFLLVARHELGGVDSPESLALTLLWFSTFILAPGVFLPVEQEVGRALAHRRALGQGGLPVVRRAAVLAAGLASILVLTVAATSPVLVHQLFHGRWVLLAGLELAVLGYGMAHFSRGVLSGSDEFGRYGLLMGLDGALRMAGCLALAVLGVHALGAYGLLVGLPPIVATLVAVRKRTNRLEPGPQASWNELTPNLGWLLGGSLLAAALVNAGPLGAKLLAKSSQDELVNHFNAGVLISRVPLFLFQAVQAALLPKLAKLAARGAYDEFRAGFRRLLQAVLAVGAVGTIGSFVAGPVAIKLFSSNLGRRDLTLLALGSAVYMVAVALAQALIALHGHALVAVGWLAGMVTFISVSAIAGNDLLLRVELGLIFGPSVALVFFAERLRSRLASGAQPDTESLIMAMHELPLEP